MHTQSPPHPVYFNAGEDLAAIHYWRKHPNLHGWMEQLYRVAPKADITRRGYGRELIEVALPLALGAQTKFDLGPRGVSCLIELPASETESGRSGFVLGGQERRSS
jgi:hypothetical protein